MVHGRARPSLTALLEIGIMFLPAIPAYLWMWPNLEGVQKDIVQAIVYIYILIGTLFIGLRRWNFDQLGLNRQGIGLALGCGTAIITGRFLIILSIGWAAPPRLSWTRLVADLAFYFALVGLVEELLFRGLIYRLLADWRGARWAIWGSSTGFMLWHVFGQGLLVGLATLLIGLLFALLRWRGGGILGLIVLHGLWDLEVVWLVPDSNTAILNFRNISTNHPVIMWLGTALLIMVPVYLIWGYPRLKRSEESELKQEQPRL